jgi:arylformamidase
MNAELTIGGETYAFDAAAPIDISIPLRFNGQQPNAYGVAPATSEACVAGELVGDTRLGGSCNFEQYTFIPHCNGTHTECVGHITNERISVTECLRDVFVPAIVISVDPKTAGQGRDSHTPETAADLVIARRDLVNSFHRFAKWGDIALIVRTLPNPDSKLYRQYRDDIPPYFTREAMEHIVESGVRHLLVDMPSVDRLFDEGRLSNHRIFWKVEQGSFELTGIARRTCTITELIYVPNDAPDGRYLLNLQIAPFASDAASSRPMLFRITEN